jgi:hypothetical protein
VIARTLIAALVATLALSASARAQTDYAPVVGAGSFNAAPILEPGRYRDTVLPEEYLYYAVRLQPGQRLHLVANSELTGAEVADLNIAFIRVNVAAPDREALLSGIDGDELFRGGDEEPADLTTFAASTVAAEGETSSSAWEGPGVYYFGVYAAYVGANEELPRAEIPFHFELSVEGAAEPEPSPTPVATATASAAPKATPAPAEKDEDASPAVAAGAGVGGLLVGVVAGIAFLRRRRNTEG